MALCTLNIKTKVLGRVSYQLDWHPTSEYLDGAVVIHNYINAKTWSKPDYLLRDASVAVMRHHIVMTIPY